VNAAVLSGTCRGVPSSGFTLKSGGFTAYAQVGGTSAACARAISGVAHRDTPSANAAWIAFIIPFLPVTRPIVGGLVVLTPTSTTGRSVYASYKPTNNLSGPCSTGYSRSDPRDYIIIVRTAAIGALQPMAAGWPRGRTSPVPLSRDSREVLLSGHCLTPVWGDPTEEALDVVAEGLRARMSYIEPQVRGIWPVVILP
jgi:hypothetical protein